MFSKIEIDIVCVSSNEIYIYGLLNKSEGISRFILVWSNIYISLSWTRDNILKGIINNSITCYILWDFYETNLNIMHHRVKQDTVPQARYCIFVICI